MAKYHILFVSSFRLEDWAKACSKGLSATGIDILLLLVGVVLRVLILNEIELIGRRDNSPLPNGDGVWARSPSICDTNFPIFDRPYAQKRSSVILPLYELPTFLLFAGIYQRIFQWSYLMPPFGGSTRGDSLLVFLTIRQYTYPSLYPYMRQSDIDFHLKSNQKKSKNYGRRSGHPARAGL